MTTLHTIAAIGPESTGKTTLCRTLSAHFGAPWIAEYARSYVEQLQRPYTYNDVELIAKQQVTELQQAQTTFKNNSWLFVDTDLIITKVWFEHVYGKCPNWLDDAIKKQKIDLYLLCKPDLTWEYDPVRENGDKRDFFYDWYKREINNTQTAYAEIGGTGDKRTACAIQKIHETFYTNN